MAKRKAVKKQAVKKQAKSSPQTTITMYVPDSIINLPSDVLELFGKITLFWSTPFGVTDVDIEPLSAHHPHH